MASSRKGPRFNPTQSRIIFSTLRGWPKKQIHTKNNTLVNGRRCYDNKKIITYCDHRSSPLPKQWDKFMGNILIWINSSSCFNCERDIKKVTGTAYHWFQDMLPSKQSRTCTWPGYKIKYNSKACMTNFLKLSIEGPLAIRRI